jgi:membrane protein DedA with SNARE-associated domain
MVVASVTGQLTHWIAQHGVYAVFVLMAFDALLPVGGELIMLYAGVLAAGAVAGQTATLFGVHLHHGLESYLVLGLAGSLGYLVGAIAGWVIGVRGGRPLVERHGRLLHLGPGTLERAERWSIGEAAPPCSSAESRRSCARSSRSPQGSWAARSPHTWS